MRGLRVLLACGVVSAGCSGTAGNVDHPRAALEGNPSFETLAGFCGDDGMLTRWSMNTMGASVIDIIRVRPDKPPDAYRVSRLLAALRVCPGNPFAWARLSEQLAFHGRPFSAIRAAKLAQEALNRHDRAGRDSNAHTRDLRLSTYLLLGHLYITVTDFGWALESLARLEGVDPPLPPHVERIRLWLLAEAYIGIGNAWSAADTIRLAGQIETHPGDTLTPEEIEAFNLYLLGRLETSKGNYVLGSKWLERAIERSPGFWNAQYCLATTALSVSDYKTADRLLRKIAGALPSGNGRRPENLYFALGNAALARGDFRAAEAEYARASETLSSRSERFLAVAEATRDPSYTSLIFEAIMWPLWPVTWPSDLTTLVFDEPLVSAFEERIPSDDTSTFPEAVNGRGVAQLALFESGQEADAHILGSAIGHFREAAAAPKYRTPHIARANLGRALWIQGEFATALSELHTTLKARPDFDAGIRALTELSVLEPRDDWASRGIIVATEAMANPEIGHSAAIYSARLARMEERLEHASGDPSDIARANGRILTFRGPPTAVRDFYEAQRVMFPDDAWPAVGLSRAEVLQGITSQDALERLDWAIERLVADGRAPWVESDLRDALVMRAKLRLQSGDGAGAVNDLSEALVVWPGWAPARNTLSSVRAAAS